MILNAISPVVRMAKGFAMGALAAAAMLHSPLQAQEAKFPSQPVTLMLPFPQGSASDTIARILQEQLSARWGVAVIVENKPGASGEIAFSSVARAKPDGHTLLLTPDAIVVNPILKGQGIETVFERLKPITVLAEAPLAFLVPASLPVKDAQDFIKYVKANPKKLNFGSSGVGSVPYLSVEYFLKNAGIEMVHIPYKGAGQTMNALFANEVQLFLGDVNRYLAYEDRLKAIAVTGQERDARIPDVPTLAESGFPDANIGLWLFAFAPAGTPPQLLEHLNKELTAVMTSPEFQQKMKAQGYKSIARTTDQTHKFVTDVYAFWNKVVVDGKLTFVQ